MTTKEKMLRAVNELPDDASVEDAMEKLLVLAKIDRGIEQADAGKTITQQAVRERMAVRRGILLSLILPQGRARHIIALKIPGVYHA